MKWNYWIGLLRHIATPRLDVPLALAIACVLGISLMNLHSAAQGDVGMVQAQSMRLLLGVAVMWVLSRVPPVQLRLWTPWFFFAGLILLALVPWLGTGRSGRHWLNLGVLFIQPAELLKLGVPMAVAAYLHGRALPPRWRDLLVCALIIALPTGLILLQPDLGTGLLVASSGVFVVFLSGIQWWRMLAIGGCALALAPVGWLFLREYQRNRLRTFLDPEADPLGTGWNIIQSQIAVGSGGLWGKGWGHGTQSRLDFLPEHTTDFILAVFAEEFGLVGMAVLLTLFLFIIGRCLWIAAGARDTWSRLCAGSIALSLSVYVVVNGGMVSGLLPVVGVPMPLLSYGGTSAVTLLAGMGLVMSVHAHRKFMK